MLTVPPASLTRSAMLTSPSPLPRSSERATSNPLPSSAIVISAWSPERSSRTSARLAPACAMTLRSASCAIRYRQSATSGAMDAKSPSALHVRTRAVRALELGTVGGQGGHQPGVPQHRGMQVVGEVTDVLRERGGALVKRPQIRLQLLADAATRPFGA